MILLSCAGVFAQENMRMLVADQKGDLSRFKLHLSNHNFFKNNEYFNDYVYSYTLLGAHLKPMLIYDISKKLSVSGGLYLQKYAGTDVLNTLKPLYRIEYKPVENLSIIMGAIDGGWKHRLVEQIYRFDRHLIDNDEEGVQFVFDNGKAFGDVWINWDKAAFPRDLHQEQLQIGISGEFSLFTSGFSKLNLVGQMLWAHNGGQDLAVTYRVRSFGALAGGLRFSRMFALRQASGCKFESIFIRNSYLSPEKKLPYRNGYGIHTQLEAYYSYFSLSVAYWYGHQYFSALGEPLYQSVSNKWGSVFAPERRVFTGKFAFIKEVTPGLKVAVHYGAYWGRDIKSFDYFYGMHLILNYNVFFKKS